MKLTDKMAYLRGMVDGMELDLTTKEGKVLANILEVMQETVLYVDDLQNQVDELTELCDSIDEDLGDVESFLYEDEEDDDDMSDFIEDDCCDDYDDDEQYEVVCPSCNNTIVLTDSVLDEGSMHCPCCNELLEFDFSELTIDEFEHSDSDDNNEE
ncbi:MAG: hypothetical protein IJZ64_06430 [Ruminococcus sp.]|nr:hypothetical protein [Ruminococcus sp.]